METSHLLNFIRHYKKVKKYRKIKTDIRNQSKTQVKQITKQQRGELLDQEGNVGK